MFVYRDESFLIHRVWNAYIRLDVGTPCRTRQKGRSLISVLSHTFKKAKETKMYTFILESTYNSVVSHFCSCPSHDRFPVEVVTKRASTTEPVSVFAERGQTPGPLSCTQPCHKSTSSS